MKSGTENRQKQKKITVRLSDGEYDTISEKAKQLGITGAEYFRKVGLEKRISSPKVDLEAGKLIAYELRKIGNNLNQLARLANQGHIDDCTRQLEQIQEQMKLVFKSL
jgi:hypothetical protein